MTATAPLSRATAPGDLVRSYEELRKAGSDSDHPLWAPGLGILLGRGMAAWIQAKASKAADRVEPAARPHAEPGNGAATLPAGVSQELVKVLATMVGWMVTEEARA